MIINNRKARFNYEILETCEAGIELKGYEVKALKAGRGNITAAHVIIRGNEAWLVNAHISPYQHNNTPADYEPTRTRRLLLNADEIKLLAGKIYKTGLTIIPLKVYNKNRLVKIELGLGRGKKKADKREAIKKREWSRLRRNIETG